MADPPAGPERTVTIDEITAAVKASWTRDTCDPTDTDVWSTDNPSRGQCAVTALVVHDLLGGELLEAEVHHPDGSRQGFHYWNLIDGVEVDLTRQQFIDGEIIQEPHPIARDPAFPWLAHEQYLIFRSRVQGALPPPTPEQ